MPTNKLTKDQKRKKLLKERLKNKKPEYKSCSSHFHWKCLFCKQENFKLITFPLARNDEHYFCPPCFRYLIQEQEREGNSLPKEAKSFFEKTLRTLEEEAPPKRILTFKSPTENEWIADIVELGNCDE